MQLLILLLALLLSAFLSPQEPEAAQKPAFDQTHAAWTTVLTKHLHKQDMDYGALAKNRAAFDGYIDALQAVAPDAFEQWSKDERHAFWINAYNAYTIQLVIDHYPVASIRDIGTDEESPWDRRFIPLKSLFPKAPGKQLSLNDIEHKILRPELKDARIHAAVNCASVSCPPLASAAFTAKQLDKMLGEQTKLWLADSARNKFSPSESRVQLSEIFSWYGDDFKPKGAQLGLWLSRHAPEQYREWLTAGKFEVQFLDYDWRLNDTKRKR